MADKVEFTVDPQWAARLEAAGLAAFDNLMRASSGEVRKIHLERSETYRMVLPDGQSVFVKRWLYTRGLDILKDLVLLRPPQVATQREAWACRRLAELDIPTPRVIAEGQLRRGPLPHQGVFVSLPLPGKPLSAFLTEAPAAAIRQVMREIGKTLRRINEADLCWPDLHLRHVHVMDDGRVGILDLERVHPRGLMCKVHHRRNIERLIKQLPNVPTEMHQELADAAGS